MQSTCTSHVSQLPFDSYHMDIKATIYKTDVGALDCMQNGQFV